MKPQEITVTTEAINHPDRSAATTYRINDPATRATGYAYAGKDEPGYIRITGASAHHHSHNQEKKAEHDRMIFARIREAIRTTICGPVIILP